MRIVHEAIPAPKMGQQRYKEAFLFLPMRIGNETRFLEKAAWSEVYVEGSVEGDGNFWAKDEWLNK